MGNGKTTFLKMWKQHLKNEGFAVVGFNAWETDFAQFPLIPLTSEFLHSLELLEQDGDLELDAVATTLPRFLRIALTKAVPWAISASSIIGTIHANEPMVALAGQTTSAGVSDIMEEITKTEPSHNPPEPLTYIEAKEAINSFKNALANTAQILSEKHEDKPLIIAIDELDRCRPTYAIELLEVVKHFYSIKNVAFSLAIDRTQLSHAIRAVYGNDFGISRTGLVVLVDEVDEIGQGFRVMSGCSMIRGLTHTVLALLRLSAAMWREPPSRTHGAG